MGYLASNDMMIMICGVKRIPLGRPRKITAKLSWSNWSLEQDLKPETFEYERGMPTTKCSVLVVVKDSLVPTFIFPVFQTFPPFNQPDTPD
jgi:hypothetical protein